MGIPLRFSAGCKVVVGVARRLRGQSWLVLLIVGDSINQSIKMQDQLCQWPNKPRPKIWALDFLLLPLMAAGIAPVPVFLHHDCQSWRACNQEFRSVPGTGEASMAVYPL